MMWFGSNIGHVSAHITFLVHGVSFPWDPKTQTSFKKCHFRSCIYNSFVHLPITTHWYFYGCRPYYVYLDITTRLSFACRLLLFTIRVNTAVKVLFSDVNSDITSIIFVSLTWKNHICLILHIFWLPVGILDVLSFIIIIMESFL